MNWKVAFLAILILTTIAVTISAATSVHIPSIPERGFHKVSDPIYRPMEPIDDESGPG